LADNDVIVKVAIPAKKKGLIHTNEPIEENSSLELSGTSHLIDNHMNTDGCHHNIRDVSFTQLTEIVVSGSNGSDSAEAGCPKQRSLEVYFPLLK
jgi:hypothetical protein